MRLSSLLFDRGNFLLCAKGVETMNISADSKEDGFLEGRLKEDVRPLCFFDRPGTYH